MSNGARFNLVEKPWITVLDLAGRQHELSILDVFEQAPRLGAVSGEVATQAFAVTRLLLAFLHRAVEGPADQDEWAQLWESPELPMDRIRDYAQKVRERLDLFDPEAPFFQVAGLRTAKGEVSGLEKIIADVPNGERFFTTRSAANLRRITPAEGARWLVNVHAFDTSGIKSGAVGDPKVKGGRGYPIGTGWSGQIGGVLPQGRNLRETLLLNLISQDVGSFVRIGGSGDLPPWEREPDGAAWFEDRPPRGAIDLYTWQTRRVRLVGNGDGVTGVVLANGDKILPQNRQGVDPHTAWRFSAPQTKKFKATTYMPLQHDPNQSVWRGIAAMLPSVSGRRSGGRGGQQKYLAPGVLQWLGDLVMEGHLSKSYVPRVRVIGVEYGAQSATYGEIIDDVLPLSVALLLEDHPAVGRLAHDAVDSDARSVATAVWSLAENIARAGGAEPKAGAGERAQTEFYSRLEAPYRSWLARLGPGADRETELAEWQKSVRDAVMPVAEELVAAAPPAAWRGRKIREKEKQLTVPLAHAWFTAAVRRALPLAYARIENEPVEVTV
jgi:CRISPR system Cascade subunit CasA